MKFYLLQSVKLKYLTFLLLVSNTSCCKWPAWNGHLDWWQTTTVYQIYPRSFQDSDGDGYGDLRGIAQRLDYLKETGVETIWISPIYKSPMIDLGYDVSDFKKIDPIFGDVDDFKFLVAEVEKRGMYILLDFVPNHSSSEHEWFQKSIRSIDPYTDYYVWKNGGEKIGNNTQPEYPNNWLSLFGGSAWEYNEIRQQFFLHQFAVHQPDLNYNNPNLIEEMKDVLKYWLDLGVDGFRVDAVLVLMEDPELTDEACFPGYTGNCEEDYTKMYHNYTVNWPTTYDRIFEWRDLLENYPSNHTKNHTRVMLTEAYTYIQDTMAYYGTDLLPGAHFPFNFFLILRTNFTSDALDFIDTISLYYNNVPEGKWTNWVIGNHDQPRVASRVGNEMVDGHFIMGMLLPGTPVTYQGDEIGQPNNLIRPDQVRDPQAGGVNKGVSRDPERGPFLWDDSLNAGFTTAKTPWEPIHPSFWEINLEAQKKAQKSHYKIFKQLVQLRKKTTILRGDLQLFHISKWVFAFTRNYPGYESYVIVINVGSETEVITLGNAIGNLPDELAVELSSVNSGYEDGDIINTNIRIHKKSELLVLRPKASVVLTTDLSDQPTTVLPASNTTSNFTINKSGAPKIDSNFLLIIQLTSFIIFCIYA